MPTNINPIQTNFPETISNSNQPPAAKSDDRVDTLSENFSTTTNQRTLMEISLRGKLRPVGMQSEKMIELRDLAKVTLQWRDISSMEVLSSDKISSISKNEFDIILKEITEIYKFLRKGLTSFPEISDLSFSVIKTAEQLNKSPRGVAKYLEMVRTKITSLSLPLGGDIVLSKVVDIQERSYVICSLAAIGISAQNKFSKKNTKNIIPSGGKSLSSVAENKVLSLPINLAPNQFEIETNNIIQS